MRSESRPKSHEERRAGHERGGDQQVRRLEIELERVLEEEERIELARVPDDALAGGGAQECEQHDARVAPSREAFRERRAREPALRLHLDEDRRLLELEPDVDRNAEQDDRDQERHAPAPVAEGFLAEAEPAGENHGERQEEAERRGRLDPARVVAALSLRRVLGDISRRAAVFAAERETLREAEATSRIGAQMPICA